MKYKTPNCSRKRSFLSTAAAESSIVEEVDQQGAPTNIYLSPLATKVKALRFASYWQLEGRLRGKVSILLPEDSSYLQDTTTGLKRLNFQDAVNLNAQVTHSRFEWEYPSNNGTARSLFVRL